MELERGRIIAQRARRMRDMDRYVAGKKVQINVALPGHPLYAPGCVNMFYVGGVMVAHQNILEDDYPSEGVMAVVAVAVATSVGVEGIPPVMDDSPEAVAARERRTLYRDMYLGQWREHSGEK